jgi:hypothetical protein
LPQPQSKKTSRASVPLSLRRTKKKTAFLWQTQCLPWHANQQCWAGHYRYWFQTCRFEEGQTKLDLGPLSMHVVTSDSKHHLSNVSRYLWTVIEWGRLTAPCRKAGGVDSPCFRKALGSSLQHEWAVVPCSIIAATRRTIDETKEEPC